MWIYAVLIALSRVDHHRASSERRDRRRDRRRGRGAPGAQLVCRAPARFCGRTRWFGAARCPAERRGASSKQLPAGCTLPRRRHERRTKTPGRLGHRSGAERGRQHRAAAWPRSRRRWPAAHFEVIYRQRRLDRRHRGRTRAPAGARIPGCAKSARALVRAIGGAAHRHGGGARARHRRRSTATARTIRRSCRSLIEALEQRRAAHGPGRRPARRPQGHGVQAIAVARRQRACAARSCATAPATAAAGSRRSARRRPGAAVFRRAASLPAGAGSARRPRHRLCRRGRPAAPCTARRTMGCGTGCGSASSISAACGG